MKDLNKQNVILTVIIPTYNAVYTIKQAISSILVQKRKAFIIIVDDCSTDGTIELIKEEFCCECETGQIKIITLKNNSGPSIARQEGIRNVVTPYLTFMDADDCYISDMALLQMQNILQQENPDLLMFKYITLHKKIQLKKRYHYKEGLTTVQEALITKICHPNPIWHYVWNKCYKTRIIKEHSISFNPHLRSAEDVAFNEDYLICVNNIYYLDEYHYLYNCTNNNSLTRHPNTHIENNKEELLLKRWENERLHYFKIQEHIRRLNCYTECIDFIRKDICYLIYYVRKEIQGQPYETKLLAKIQSECPEYGEVIKKFPQVKREYYIKKTKKNLKLLIKRI